MRNLTLVFLFCLPAAADFLPLEPGNQWTYRKAGGTEEFTIEVGVPALIAGEVYHRLSGYVGDRVWARSSGSALYYRDEERGADVLLTSFTSGERFDAPLRPCSEEGAPREAGEAIVIPSGRFQGALSVQYRVLNCADAGVTEEVYLENVGMLRRKVTTIAGERSFELVHARVGGLTVAERPNTLFRVAVQAIEPQRVIARLRLSVSGPPLELTFPTTQEFDAAVRTPDGDTIALWSSGKAFEQVITYRSAGNELSYTVELPLARPLDPGTYILGGWLTTNRGGREFAASTAFEVPDSAGRTVNGGPEARIMPVLPPQSVK